MIENSLIIFVTVTVGAVLLLPRVSNNNFWRATITPLASIIGSGFLVLGPVLDHAYGGSAPIVMTALCVTAWCFGSAIRANIASENQILSNPPTRKLEQVSSVALAFAYVISVAYYLNLFGAFAVRLTSLNDSMSAKLVTTGVFALVILVGWTRGFKALERLEQISVGIKLAIIAGLLAGLTLFFGEKLSSAELVFNPPTETGLGAITLAFGLIITIQGFETSRYLGENYSVDMRIRSMRFAQLLSSAIYVTYIILIAYLFQPEQLDLSETAIIDMMEVVAPILPAILIAAALSAQFSAAIADTSGSGGLITEITKGRISSRSGYVILVVLGVGLTWSSNIFEIISYASRAFAFYYSIQAAIAAIIAYKKNTQSAQTYAFAILCLLGICITAFGKSVE